MDALKTYQESLTALEVRRVSQRTSQMLILSVSQRVLSTPIPIAYSLHLRHVAWVYLISL